ncbi:MAG: carboxypeptidase-like regulatory domain-containing protein [Armatimonadota bacterium]|nr:carboxypeptidase-like regulatory domain-containing protein [Armatimonadota bacterium]
MRNGISLLVLISVLAACPAHSDEARQFSLSGHVTMSDGSPAAGAIVEIRYPKDAGRSVADGSGTYKLSLPPGDYNIGAHLGQYVLTVDRYIQLDGNGAVSGSTELRLDPAAVVAGKVVDRSTGQPVPGAKVTIRDFDDAETDNHGIYRFEAVPRRTHTIAALKDGFGRPIMHFSAIGQSFVQVDIDVRPEGVLKGRVTDDLGNPVAGASVGPRLWYFDVQRVETDSNGEYTLPGLDPTERTEVGVSADGYGWVMDMPVVFPTDRREITIDVKLTSTKDDIRTISGRVLDQLGNPVKEALVEYGWTDCYAGHKTTRTDDDGRYTLRDVDGTKNMVIAEANGFAPSFRFVEEKVNAEIDFTMAPGHFVEGKFVDEDGKPLEAVRVGLDVITPEMEKMGFHGDNVYRWVSSRAKSDKSGRFRLDNLPAKGVLIETYLAGYSRIDRMPLEVDREDHVITVTRPGQVSGTVLNATDGKPMTEFEVGRSYDTKGVVFKSAQGRFTMPSDFTTPGEKIDFFVRAPGHFTAHLEDVEVRPGSKIDYNAVRVKLQRSRRLSGVVTEAGSGKPLAGVAVTLLDTQGGTGGFQWRSIPEVWRPISVRTDAGGRFTIDTVPGRRGAILLEKDGYARTVLPDASFLKPLKACLGRGSTVSGVVSDDSGKPAKGVYVEVTDSEGQVQYDSAYSDSEGKFRFANLPPGELRVEHSESRVTKMHEFTVAAGQEYVVDWNRREPSQVEGKIALDGAPVEGAHVIVHSVSGKMYGGFAYTGKDGVYRFPVHKPGNYSVTYSKGDWMDSNHIWIRDIVTIKPGTNRFDVAFPSGGISGRLIDARTRKPIADMSVQAYALRTEKQERGAGEDWSFQHTQAWWWPKNETRTDADGGFEIKNVDEGKWTIVALPRDAAGPVTPVCRVQLGKNEKKTGVVAAMPEVGSAEIRVVDGRTGRPAAKAVPICVNDWGFAFYPKIDQSRRGHAAGASGGVLFAGLPPGRYKVFVVSQSYMPARAVIDVKPVAVTKPTVKLQRGQKIVFRLMETDSDPMSGRPWIGYKISRPGSSKPVLIDYQGPYWGDIAFFDGAYPRTANVPIEPRTYNLDLVLRRERSSSGLMADKNLWSGKLKVKVVKGKHTVIDIPVKGK